MGSCISKCMPKNNKSQEEEQEEEEEEDDDNNNSNSNNSITKNNVNVQVQDKLVISSSQHLPPPPPPQNPLSPSPSPTSTSSFSTYSSCSTATSNGICSSLASSLSSCSSSSILSPKDRSFSNEFLWSCAKENPHIIGLDNSSRKVLDHKSSSLVLQSRKLGSPPAKPLVVPPTKQSIPQKRACSRSPTLTRQKSFRSSTNSLPSTYTNLPTRTLKSSSPSPSRRFSGDHANFRAANSPAKVSKEGTSLSHRPVVSKGNNAVVRSCSLLTRKKEYLWPAGSPLNNPSSKLLKHYPDLRSRETLKPRIGSKMDGISGGDLVANMDIDSILTADIDNPLISLDCFIFL